MRKIFYLGAVFAASLALTCSVVAETQWPSFQPGLNPGKSNSSLKAAYPDDVKIVAATSGVPADRAKLIGKWDGWMCERRSGDTKAAFEKIEGDNVTVVYAYANEKLNQQPYTRRIDARFVGSEIQGRFPDGAQLFYRPRSDGNLDVMVRSANNSSVFCSGIINKVSDN